MSIATTATTGNLVAAGKKEMRVHVWEQTHKYIQDQARILGVPVSCFVDHLVTLHKQKFQTDHQFTLLHERLDDIEDRLVRQ